MYKRQGFIEENADKDSWFLQIESFSPHEPFMAWEEFKNLYPGKEKGKKYEWPDYAPVKERAEEIDAVSYTHLNQSSNPGVEKRGCCIKQNTRIFILLSLCGFEPKVSKLSWTNSHKMYKY